LEKLKEKIGFDMYKKKEQNQDAKNNAELWTKYVTKKTWKTFEEVIK
jgi:hypothetical protein